MKRLNFFKFTDKKYHPIQIMAVILGCIGLISIVAAGFLPYFFHSQDFGKYALVCFMSWVLGLISFILAMLGKQVENSYKRISSVAYVEDALILVVGIIIIYMGK